MFFFTFKNVFLSSFPRAISTFCPIFFCFVFGIKIHQFFKVVLQKFVLFRLCHPEGFLCGIFIYFFVLFLIFSHFFSLSFLAFSLICFFLLLFCTKSIYSLIFLFTILVWNSWSFIIFFCYSWSFSLWVSFIRTMLFLTFQSLHF